MKINKITAIICGILTILSGVGIVLISLFAPKTAGYDAIQGIISSIFGGFVVSLVVPTINYFHERDVIMENTSSGIQSLYINLYVISKMVGKILPQIPFAIELELFSFKQVYELSTLNVDFLKYMNLNLFNPFFKSGKFSQAYSELKEFQQTGYNIKNISTSLYGQVQDYNIKILTLQNNVARGMLVDPTTTNNMALEKNAINVRTAKFHEYVTSQLFELEKIAKLFYASKGGKQSWKDIKPALLQQAEEIMRR